MRFDSYFSFLYALFQFRKENNTERQQNLKYYLQEYDKMLNFYSNIAYLETQITQNKREIETKKDATRKEFENVIGELKQEENNISKRFNITDENFNINNALFLENYNYYKKNKNEKLKEFFTNKTNRYYLQELKSKNTDVKYIEITTGVSSLELLFSNNFKENEELTDEGKIKLVNDFISVYDIKEKSLKGDYKAIIIQKQLEKAKDYNEKFEIVKNTVKETKQLVDYALIPLDLDKEQIDKFRETFLKEKVLEMFLDQRKDVDNWFNNMPKELKQEIVNAVEIYQKTVVVNSPTYYVLSKGDNVLEKDLLEKLKDIEENIFVKSENLLEKNEINFKENINQNNSVEMFDFFKKTINEKNTIEKEKNLVKNDILDKFFTKEDKEKYKINKKTNQLEVIETFEKEISKKYEIKINVLIKDLKKVKEDLKKYENEKYEDSLRQLQSYLKQIKEEEKNILSIKDKTDKELKQLALFDYQKKYIKEIFLQEKINKQSKLLQENGFLTVKNIKDTKSRDYEKIGTDFYDLLVYLEEKGNLLEQATHYLNKTHSKEYLRREKDNEKVKESNFLNLEPDKKKQNDEINEKFREINTNINLQSKVANVVEKKSNEQNINKFMNGEKFYKRIGTLKKDLENNINQYFSNSNLSEEERQDKIQQILATYQNKYFSKNIKETYSHLKKESEKKKTEQIGIFDFKKKREIKELESKIKEINDNSLEKIAVSYSVKKYDGNLLESLSKEEEQIAEKIIDYRKNVFEYSNRRLDKEFLKTNDVFINLNSEEFYTTSIFLDKVRENKNGNSYISLYEDFIGNSYQERIYKKEAGLEPFLKFLSYKEEKPEIKIDKDVFVGCVYNTIKTFEKVYEEEIKERKLETVEDKMAFLANKFNELMEEKYEDIYINGDNSKIYDINFNDFAYSIKKIQLEKEKKERKENMMKKEIKKDLEKEIKNKTQQIINMALI